MTEKAEFKVGDRVRIARVPQTWRGLPLGSEHTITRTDHGWAFFGHEWCAQFEQLESATDPLPTGHPAPGSTGLRLNEEQREALARYNGCDLKREQELTEWQRQEDELPLKLGGQSRRDRLVAALAAEMDEGELRRAALVGLVHPVTNRALGRMR